MMNEIQSTDSFILMLLSEYTDFRKKKSAADPSDENNHCFIFDYQRDARLKKARELSADKKVLLAYAGNRKKNKYILLEALCSALQNGVIDKPEFVGLFRELTGESGFNAGDTAVVIQYKRAFLLGCIDDFFINKGFSIDTGKKKQNAPEQSGSYTNELEMWSEYCKYAQRNGISLSTSSNGFELDDKYQKKCEKLLNALNAGRAVDSFVPLYFDAKIGAGIHIIGSRHFSPDKKTKKNCYVCVTSFSNVIGPEDEYMPTDAESEEPDEVCLNTEVKITLFENVGEAFSYLKENISSFAECYSYLNICRDTNKIDSSFRQFFSQDTFYKPRPDPKEAISRDLERAESLYRARNNFQGGGIHH